jgi:glycosyltransferase 2 family protein
MAPSRSSLLRSPWVRVAVAALVLLAWAWFLRGQLETLRAYEWRVGPLPFAAAVGLGALYFGGLALSWTLLLRTYDGAARKVPLVRGVGIWTGTMLSRYVPGNIWHIVGRVALAERLGVSRGQVAASATVEQLLTLLAALAVFGLSLPLWRGGAGPESRLLLLAPVGLALLHPRVFGAAMALAARRLRRPSWRGPTATGSCCWFSAWRAWRRWPPGSRSL